MPQTPGETQNMKAPGREEGRMRHEIKMGTQVGNLPTFRILAARYLFLKQETAFILGRKRTEEVMYLRIRAPNNEGEIQGWKERIS